MFGEAGGCKGRRVRRGAGRGCGQARQTAPTETTSRLGPRRCPGNARPCVIRGQQETGRRGPPTPRHSKTPREPGPGGAGRGLDSWRRAPTRPERLSASGLLPPRAPKGSAGELGAGSWGGRPAGSRAGQRYVPGTPGFPGSPQIGLGPGDASRRGLAKEVAAPRWSQLCARRPGPGMGAGDALPGHRSAVSASRSPSGGARPGGGMVLGARWARRGAAPVARPARPAAPGDSPGWLRSGAGHGSPPGRRSSPDAGGASSARPARAAGLGRAGRGAGGRGGSAPRARAGGPALGPSCAGPAAAAAAAAPAPQRPSHRRGAAAASARASCRPPSARERVSERRAPAGGRGGGGRAGPGRGRARRGDGAQGGRPAIGGGTCHSPAALGEGAGPRRPGETRGGGLGRGRGQGRRRGHRRPKARRSGWIRAKWREFPRSQGRGDRGRSLEWGSDVWGGWGCPQGTGIARLSADERSWDKSGTAWGCLWGRGGQGWPRGVGGYLRSLHQAPGPGRVRWLGAVRGPERNRRRLGVSLQV